jgi:hypothetical protein
MKGTSIPSKMTVKVMKYEEFLTFFVLAWLSNIAIL